MVFCNSDWKFFNLRSPSGGSRSVDAFPAEWEAADPIKQAAERRALRKIRRHSPEHPAPERECDGVAECLVLRRVRFLVYAAFLVCPVADTDPSVRIPLKPCASNGVSRRTTMRSITCCCVPPVPILACNDGDMSPQSRITSHACDMSSTVAAQTAGRSIVLRV